MPASALVRPWSPAPMPNAGGRLFVDITDDLASPVKREMIIGVLGKFDPLIKDALMTIMAREDFIKPLPNDENELPVSSDKGRLDFKTLNDYDPAVVGELIKSNQISIDELKQNIRTRSATDLIDFILEDTRQSKKSLTDPKSFGVIMTGMNASSWINEKMKEWLGEKNVADIARENGLPAVVGVENATKLIKDGQRIRVHGTEGYVEIL
jgi:pyruvate,water dikinase